MLPPGTPPQKGCLPTLFSPFKAALGRITRPLQRIQTIIHKKWYLRYAPVLLGAGLSMARTAAVDARLTDEYEAAARPLDKATFARIRSAQFVTWHDNNPHDNIITWPEAMEFLHQAPFDKEQVEFIMDRMFATVISPEAFCVLTNVLLETFEAAKISPALRAEYQQFVHRKFNGGYDKAPLHISEVAADFAVFLKEKHATSLNAANPDDLKLYFAEYLDANFPGYSESYLYKFLASTGVLLQVMMSEPFVTERVTNPAGQNSLAVVQYLPPDIEEGWTKFLAALDMEKSALLIVLNDHADWMGGHFTVSNAEALQVLMSRAQIVQNKFPGSQHPQVWQDRAGHLNEYLSGMQAGMAAIIQSGENNNPDVWETLWGNSFTGMYSTWGGITGELSGFYFLDLAGHSALWNIVRSLPFALAGSMFQASDQVAAEVEDVRPLNFCMPVGGFVCDMPIDGAEK